MKKLTKAKWLKVCLLLFVVTLPPFISGCGGNQSEPTFNIAGSWNIFHTTTGTAGEEGPDLFTFTTSNNDVSGTTPLNQLITGNVSGLNVSFSWVGSDGATNTYTGVVSADGATMSGTWTSTNGHSGTWHAIVNVAPAVSITGNWNIFHTTTGTAGEEGPDLFIFTQSGNGISGTTSLNQQIIGTISHLDITFSWVGSDGATNIYTGAVSANGATMSGTWMSTNGHAGTWRATKS